MCKYPISGRIMYYRCFFDVTEFRRHSIVWSFLWLLKLLVLHRWLCQSAACGHFIVLTFLCLVGERECIHGDLRRASEEELVTHQSANNDLKYCLSWGEIIHVLLIIGETKIVRFDCRLFCRQVYFLLGRLYLVGK